jgi:hypothetical protein
MAAINDMLSTMPAVKAVKEGGGAAVKAGGHGGFLGSGGALACV